MPCTKCEEGKYKWGKTGECKYDSLDACESANSKYSKMKPTPLGKKTYAEYEKELKEFNLSKAERVELGELQDLEKLINLAEKQADATYNATSKLQAKLGAIEGLAKRYEDRREDMENMQKEGLKVRDNAVKDRDNIESSEEKLNSTVAKARAIIKNMRTVEKELGVTVPGIKAAQSKLETYSKVFQKADKTITAAHKAFGDAAALFR
jgi:chromosome segregation ATPase